MLERIRRLIVGTALISLATVSTALAENVTIQYFLGGVPDLAADSVGVLVVDTAANGFDSVYKAGVNGQALAVGESIANSDDVIIGVTASSSEGFASGGIGFADSFASINYSELGLAAGMPVKFFWFPSASSSAPVLAVGVGFLSYTDSETGTGGDQAYVLPAGPGVFTLTNLDTPNGGAEAVVSPVDFEGVTGPIVTSPVGGSFDVGTDVTLTVVTQGDAELSFQWFEGQAGDVSDPLGGDNPDLVVPSVFYGSSFWVRVSDDSGSVDSDVANIAVNGGGLRPEFTWSEVDGAEWYNLHIMKDGALWSNFWVQGVTSWTPDSDLTAGNYTWYVKSWGPANGHGQWSDAVTFSFGIPQLLTPEGVQPEGQLRPLFTWTRSLGATYYNLYIVRNGALWQSIWLEGFTSDSWQSDVDMPIGNYTFYVSPYSPQGGVGPFSEPMSFSMGIPQLLTPEGVQAEGQWRPEFTWTRSPNATYYNLNIMRNGALWQSIWLEGFASDSWQSDVDMPHGSYTFSVAPYSPQGGVGPFSEPMAFSLGLPEQLAPEGLQDRGVTMPEFSWNGSSELEYYNIYLTRNGALWSDTWIQAPATTWTPSDVLGSGNYKWWLRGWSSAGGLTPYSESKEFEIRGLAPLSPIGTVSGNLRPSFQWEAEPGATWYQLYVGQGSEVIFYDWLQGTSWTPTTDLLEGSYSWYIRSHGPATGTGAWNGPIQFQIEGAVEASPIQDLTITSGPANTRGDFNEDGMGDLVMQNSETGEVMLQFLSGDSLIGESNLSIQSGTAEWAVVGHGDIDNDQDNDLLWQNTRTGEILVWFLEDGSTVSGSVELDYQFETPQWRAVSVTDFNGDGHADLLVQNAETGASQVLLLVNFKFQSSVELSESREAAWTAIAALDFDEDGATDVLWQNKNTGSVEISYLSGEAPFEVTNVASLELGNMASKIIVAIQDVDGDEQLDLISQESESGQISVFFLNGTSLVSNSMMEYQSGSPVWEIKNSRPAQLLGE